MNHIFPLKFHVILITTDIEVILKTVMALNSYQSR